jgi:hypothetical protein
VRWIISIVVIGALLGGWFVAWQYSAIPNPYTPPAVVDFIDKHNGVMTTFFTLVLAVSTIFLWRSTRDAARAANTAAQHTRTVERAYVTLSHAPPGLRTENVEGQLSVQISVKNFGTTPAKVTDILMKPIVLPNNQSLPKRPDYARVWGPILPQAFLVAQEEFFYDVAFNISLEQMAAVNNAFTHTLYLIGYVDYIDQFGQRHRGGYARMYKPLTGLLQHQGNLVYVVQEGYNYDRRRTRGEGEDWLREGSAF